MSRVHEWQFLLNREGQPIADTSVYIYLAGTEIPARIFTDEVGGTMIDTEPQVTTNANGFFQFWIADNTEQNGYDISQKFKIKWAKAGVASGYIDWVDVFPKIQQAVAVDETDQTSVFKDKLVSNRLAYQWEEHRGWTYVDGWSNLHGLAPVNLTEQDTTDKNKLISNGNGYKWETHVNKTDPTDAHGMGAADLTSTNTAKTKLIDNNTLKTFNDDRLVQYSYTLIGGDPGVVPSSNWVKPNVGVEFYYTEINIANGYEETSFPVVQLWDTDTRKDIKNIDVYLGDETHVYDAGQTITLEISGAIPPSLNAKILFRNGDIGSGTP
jgi:hypothetical protein